MGCIGLLLNAPYKIDSMVWMRLWMMLCLFLLLEGFPLLIGLYEPEAFFGSTSLKMGVPRVFGV
jgi:hypothetical protein